MQFVPYLNFDGDCAEAMAFYARLFGGQIVHQSTFGEMPPGEGMPPLPEAARSRLMHAQLQVGAQSLMASDTLPAMPGLDLETCGGGYRKPQGLWVSIGVDRAGVTPMPSEWVSRVWAPRAGMLCDDMAAAPGDASANAWWSGAMLMPAINGPSITSNGRPSFCRASSVSWSM